MRLGLGSLVVSLGGAAIELNDERTQLGAFVVSEPADVVVQLSAGYVPASQPGGFRVLDSSYEEAEQSVKVSTTDWSASFHLAAGTVDASLRLLRPLVLDSLLRTTAQAFALTLGKGVYLHAASVVKDGEGYVFMGPSEAGKTTVAGLSRDVGLEVVDEELTCVAISGGRVRLMGTPFFQKSGFVGRPLDVPLRRVYFLSKASRDAVTALPQPRALAALVTCISVGSRQPPLLAAGFDAAIRLLRCAPVRLLYFRQSAAFWDAIDDDVRSS